ncbi:MAG: NTP transferase domain-containing protein [Bacteriovoracaceae bacterium]|jgi:D-glycero-alpha-D-manno-heptose 1-phosphate guanylyltransferase|nr:NTP transferase domain-containing protein [Bacteriovoracaceae bacterium]
MINKDDIEIIILAGGRASRISELSEETPKALLTINEIPFLSYLLKQYSQMGFTKFCLATGHHGDELKAFGQSLDLSIRYSHENNPLGTSGAIVTAIKSSHQKYFIVMNGDTFIKFTVDISQFLEEDGLIHICTSQTDGNNLNGKIKVNEMNLITSFNADLTQDKNLFLNAGTYFFSKDLSSHFISKGSIEQDVFPELAKKKLLKAICLNDQFLDIGTYENLDKANSFLKDIEHF